MACALVVAVQDRIDALTAAGVFAGSDDPRFEAHSLALASVLESARSADQTERLALMGLVAAWLDGPEGVCWPPEVRRLAVASPAAWERGLAELAAHATPHRKAVLDAAFDGLR